jgi:alanine racemase
MENSTFDMSEHRKKEENVEKEQNTEKALGKSDESKFLRRTWAEVSLDAIKYNFLAIKSSLRPETRICCVVKADAYGHGAERLAQEYEEIGADWLAVSNLEEATQIRCAGVLLPILILGFTPVERAAQLAQLNISQAVVGERYANALNETAKSAGVTVKVHIALDTGMSRVGFLYQNTERDAPSLSEIKRACSLSNLEHEGIFTHCAVADGGDDGKAYTQMQFKKFCDATEKLRHSGISFYIRHFSNSAATLDYPEMQLDMVRPGVILYGMMPSSSILHPLPLLPAMELKSVVALVKHIPPQTSVSYGRKYTSSEEQLIATIPVGYADGYPRKLSSKADVLVRGHRAKIIGRICMDMLIANVTDIPGVRAGDIVTVFGKDGDKFISIDELANKIDTINSELACAVSKRVPREYFKKGKAVGGIDYILR